MFADLLTKRWTAQKSVDKESAIEAGSFYDHLLSATVEMCCFICRKKERNLQ